MTSARVRAFAETDEPAEVRQPKQSARLDIGTRHGRPIYVDRDVEMVRVWDPDLEKTVDVDLDDPRVGDLHRRCARGAIDMWKANRG